MSLLNAWVMPSEAIVAVDTDGVRADGAKRGMSKLFPIPHLNAVLGFRGQGAFSAAVVHSCLSRGFDTFDELLEVLPGIAEAVDACLPAFLQVSGYGDIGNEFIAAGWSVEQSRMRGRTFVKRAGMPGFAVRESQGCIAPWDAATMADMPQTPEALPQLARAQVRYLHQHCGLGGGRLIVCRATRDGMYLTHEMHFDLEDATA